MFQMEVPRGLPFLLIQLQYTDTGATYGKNMRLDLNRFSHRSSRNSRLAVDVCRIQHESTERLESEAMEDIQPLLKQIEVLRAKCANLSWCYAVLDGLWNTWNSMKQNLYLPRLDRGLSIQSAVR